LIENNKMFTFKSIILLLVFCASFTHAWSFSSRSHRASALRPIQTLETRRVPVSLFASVDEEQRLQNIQKPSPDETTKKFGLEAGVMQSLTQNDGESAKSLLKRYGIAYLATSIPLALLSFTLCYFLIDSGVDVSGLLKRIGIENDASETAGKFGLAYAAHKAASPIRFPPTVMLTPMVAKLIGKEPVSDSDEISQ
jgi:Protein of unknown function (DUF1279)